MIKYGLPYKGSKTKIADAIIEHIPPAKVFYDLFAGGCAITHAALLSGKWERVIANDIKPYPFLFRDAALGKYKDEYRWVSREEFFESDDPFVKLLFSFGNDCRTYIYAEGEKNEHYKRALHYAICFHDYKPMLELGGPDLSPIESCKTMHGRRMKAYQILGGKHGWWGVSGVHLENLERLERLQNLERLERIQSLAGTTNMDRLEVIQGNYWEVEIEEDAVIYLDPPYANTNGYGAKKISDFDSEGLYDWIEAQKAPVYISEYNMPQERFECIWELKTKSYINQSAPTEAVERLFVPRGHNYPKITLF